ncbi:MAG TPA: glycosyltransferase family A protein [Acetobacteraceae bacterium]|nr:glycosyltransferase family A protein [Acetobacteraceae bacterium]
MPATPRISVVLATCNALRHLPGAIASVGPEAEIIVVDNCSTDGSWDYLQAIAEQDPRIRPALTERPGMAAARNTGLGLASAPLVTFLDPDDRWRTGFLAAHIGLHRAFPQIGFSFSDHRRFALDGTELPSAFARCPGFQARHAMRREGFVLEGDAQAQIYAEPLVAASTVVANAALLRAVGGFNEQLGRAEAWDLLLHLAACAPVGCLPKPLVNHLVRPVDPEGEEGLARRAARRRVAEAYADQAEALDPEARRLCRLGQTTLDAEVAALAGRRVQAAWLRLSAFAQDPARVHMRAAVRELAGRRTP